MVFLGLFTTGGFIYRPGSKLRQNVFQGLLATVSLLDCFDYDSATGGVIVLLAFVRWVFDAMCGEESVFIR